MCKCTCEGLGLVGPTPSSSSKVLIDYYCFRSDNEWYLIADKLSILEGTPYVEAIQN